MERNKEKKGEKERADERKLAAHLQPPVISHDLSLYTKEAIW